MAFNVVTELTYKKKMKMNLDPDIILLIMVYVFSFIGSKTKIIVMV